MNVVVDASVIVKWVFRAPEAEENTERALELLTEIGDGKVSLLQPPHWLVEVAAVVTRLRPELAESALDLLDAMEFPIVDDLPVLQRAGRISHDLNHPLFDTLYHAVALEHDYTLVTADGQYFRKARHLGRLMPLSAWPEG